MSELPSQKIHPSPGAFNASSLEVDPQMVAARQVLPVTRDSITHKFSIGNHEGYLTVGLYPDGRPGEIFLKMSKEGSTLSGMCQAYCRAFSLSIQHGLSVRDAVSRFKGMRFEPMGPTSNPDIPTTESIVDYIARYIELHFCDTQRQ
ncbi:MAG: hypothetical protein KF859_13965 [Phycisphaeraceae bacterium]|nr:hypothetical protein [Phycisphaeraceae bacterium]